MEEVLSYRNKMVLAPMVRIGTLPMRLLALEMGADLVYCEELIDWRILKSKRIENGYLGTVDYVDTTDNSVVFRTTEAEKPKLVFQLGTCDPDRALSVGKIIEKDVGAIDINMGCPKEFSLKGGMGAALLSQPTKVKDILTTLVSNLSIPVTCKIRILDKLEDTLDLCRLIEKCGVSAIAVHGRLKHERPRHENHNDVIKIIAESLNIPVIGNGFSNNIRCYKDLEKCMKECNISSIMVARAAMWNPSIFRKEGCLSVDIMIEKYLKYCVDYENHSSNTKYTVQNMLGSAQQTEKGQKFLACQTLEEICAVWNLEKYYKQKQDEFELKKVELSLLSSINLKKRKHDNEDFLELPAMFYRRHYGDNDLPKTRLLQYAKKHGMKPPQYQTEQIDKMFYSTVSFNKKKFKSSCGEKNIRYSEQGSAIVCLYDLGIVCDPSAIS